MISASVIFFPCMFKYRIVSSGICTYHVLYWYVYVPRCFLVFTRMTLYLLVCLRIALCLLVSALTICYPRIYTYHILSWYVHVPRCVSWNLHVSHCISWHVYEPHCVPIPWCLGVIMLCTLVSEDTNYSWYLHIPNWPFRHKKFRLQLFCWRSLHSSYFMNSKSIWTSPNTAQGQKTQAGKGYVHLQVQLQLISRGREYPRHLYW